MDPTEHEGALTPAAIRLDDRIGVVTGGAAGIGRATALALARFGADVAACDRDEAGLVTLAAEVDAIGRRCVCGVLDVRDGDAVEGWASEVGDEFGRVDVLVNNVGGGFMAAFADVSAKGEAALVAENFTSVTGVIRALLPLFGPTGGCIVNITSIEAFRAAPGFAVYSAMKAGVENLTRSLALELGERLIRVNTVAPDMIPTPGLGGPDAFGAPRTPLPVQGDPDDVAAAVVYLASGMARFVTGTTLHVDGGNLAAGGWRRDPDSGAFTT